MINLKLSEDEMNLIAKALGRQPFDEVAHLVLNVIGPQVRAQKNGESTQNDQDKPWPLID
jgi:hypothetical protein